MVEMDMLPGWMVIDGTLFSRAELMRPRSGWWWSGRSIEAWRVFRIRLATLNMLVDRGEIDPLLCWADVRLYLQEGGQMALDCAKEVTARAEANRLTSRFLGMRRDLPEGLAA